MTQTTVVPTGRRRSGARWWWLGLGAGAVGLLAIRDPNQAGSYGFCPLRAATGLDCPWCGGLRGTHALLHGDITTALDHNLLLPLYLGLGLAIAISAWRSSESSADSWVRSRTLWWTVAIVSVVFMVVRNLPWFPYLDSAA